MPLWPEESGFCTGELLLVPLLVVVMVAVVVVVVVVAAVAAAVVGGRAVLRVVGRVDSIGKSAVATTNAAIAAASAANIGQGTIQNHSCIHS